MKGSAWQDGRDAFGGLLPVGVENDRPALRDDTDESWISYGDLRQQALAVADDLAAPSKRLIFAFAEQRSAAVCALLAAAAAGHAIALIDPALSRGRLARLLQLYDPDIILSGNETHPSVGHAGGWRRGFGCRGTLTWAVREQERGDVICPQLFVLLSTSGTTGSPKFVRLSADALIANADQIRHVLAIDAASVAIAHLPVHYSYGLSVVTSHLAAGARILLTGEAVTSPSFWDRVRLNRGTHFPGVPFHYKVLARLGMSQVPESVNTFTQAGGSLDLPTQTLFHAQAADRNARFFVMYGQTEAGPRMTTLLHQDFEAGRGSVGRALPGGRLTILDPTTSSERILQDGQTGAIVYTGPNVMLGYAEGRDDLARGDENGGRLETGDLGRLDAGGFLYLAGRLTRFAKVAGLRLGLDEVEREFEGVLPVACLDGDGRVLVCHDNETDTVLKKRLKELSLQYRIPSASFVILRVPAIPRKNSGKVDYGRLKELACV